MTTKEMIEKLKNGGLTAYASLYGADKEEETARYLHAVEEFTAEYGESEELYLFSVPGRTEVLGNHTDHNRGEVLAAAVDRDVIAVVSPCPGEIRVKSEGYPEDVVALDKTETPGAYPAFSSASLIAGMAGGFRNRGLKTGGFRAFTTSRVLKGSGLSSSAAFEVMIGNILNHLYSGGEVPNEEIAKIARYAENAYFGKPCGLMDQMACAVGGFVHIDFADPDFPKIDPISFSLSDKGFVLCIVNTGGNHADLNADYASVPAEMKAVAAYFGKEVLREVTEKEVLENLPVLRKTAGDRAVMRAFHFFRENERVKEAAEALKTGKTEAFLRLVTESGSSSFRFLQNVYTNQNVAEQGISLALAVTEGLLKDKGCAYRVHGGGFAGTMQAFVRKDLAEDYRRAMDAVFGDGACMTLFIRNEGAVRISL
ncbi:MAG: galactokinase [Clostridia bacterium]|nr:galactokinase [Clostridia bacterium]